MQNRYTVFALLQMLPSALEANNHLFVEGVHTLGAIDGDGGDMIDGFVGN